MKDGKFKVKRNKFAMVSNEPIDSKTLSLAAKGLYSLIQRYITIEKREDGSDFVLNKDLLQKKCKEGQKAFDTAWKELKNAGYLKINKIQTPHGYYYEYDLAETAYKKSMPIDRKSTPGKPNGGELKRGTSKSKEPITGKEISNNNTDINNTDSNNTDSNNTDFDVVGENDFSMLLEKKVNNCIKEFEYFYEKEKNLFGDDELEITKYSFINFVNEMKDSYEGFRDFINYPNYLAFELFDEYKQVFNLLGNNIDNKYKRIENQEGFMIAEFLKKHKKYEERRNDKN